MKRTAVIAATLLTAILIAAALWRYLPAPDSRPQAASPPDDGVLRDAKGQPLKMKRAEAIAACAKAGKRLSTIRELVAWEGRLVEDATFKAARIGADELTQQIETKNEGPKGDSFHNVFKKESPPRKPKPPRYWSASEAKDGSGFYSFDEASASVISGEPKDPNPALHEGAVRCVR